MEKAPPHYREDASVWKVERWRFGDFSRGRGRLKMTWMDGVKKDLKSLGLEEHYRVGWRKMIMVDDAKHIMSGSCSD